MRILLFTFIHFALLSIVYAEGLPRIADLSTIKTVVREMSHKNKEFNNMKQMYKALKNFNNKKLEKLLQSGVNPNAMINFKHPYSLLHFATGYKGGNPVAVKLLINYGANVDILGDDSAGFDTPINNAIRNNNMEIVKLLVEANATLNLEGHYFEELICNHTKIVHPPIFSAESKEMVQYLISQGANIKEQDNFGHTMLDYVDDVKFKLWLLETYKLKTDYFICYDGVTIIKHTIEGYKYFDSNGTLLSEWKAGQHID